MKLCVFCEHITFDESWGGTEATGGNDSSMSCMFYENFVDITLPALQGWALRAETCPKYELDNVALQSSRDSLKEGE